MRLEDAIQSHFAYDRHDGASVMHTTFPLQWAMGTAPHGGFLLCSIVSACETHQQKRQSPHVDCVYFSAFFFSPTPVDTKVDIVVKTKRKTKSFTYLTVELRVQQTQLLTLEVELIFGVLPAFSDTSSKSEHSPTLLPPDKGARRTPFRSLSKDLPDSGQPLISNFQSEQHWRRDPVVEEQTRAVLKGQRPADNADCLQDATWIALEDKTPLSLRHLPLFLDCFESLPELLATGRSKSWHPTLCMTAQFFSRVPDWNKEPQYQSNEFGVYSYGSQIRNGRHESLTEVWSAPNKTSPPVDWREQQRCLATATQMALTLPVKRQKGRL